MLFLAIKNFFLTFGLLFSFGLVFYIDVLSRDILSQHVQSCQLSPVLEVLEFGLLNNFLKISSFILFTTVNFLFCPIFYSPSLLKISLLFHAGVSCAIIVTDSATLKTTCRNNVTDSSCHQPVTLTEPKCCING